jgi:uncharacterized phage protein (TIGR01671 family)
MGREIKFRAWDNENKCFFADTNRAYDNVIEQLLISPAGDINLRKMNGMYHESMFPGRFVLQQYTGLKDIDSRDIYEGDICEAEQVLYPLTGTRTGIVKYHDGSYLLEDLNGLDGDFLFSETAETRIIGNIYENPELLEVTP